MSGFAYRSGVLHAEDVPLGAIAAAVGTPCYVYSANAMRGRLRAFQAALAGLPALVCYAIKANSNLAVIRLFAGEGAGADTVSGGEIARALAAGVPPRRIVYAGIGKTDAELREALAENILQFNVESAQELFRLSEIAAAMGRTAAVALRVNPDVAAGGHEKISTGRRGDKFGIPFDEAGEAFAMAARLPGIDPVGVHLHIGSQITALEPFSTAYRRGVDLYRGLRAAGLPLRRLDLGGGFGVGYRDEVPIAPEQLGRLVREVTAGLDAELLFEPGRALVAEAGLLLSSVIYLKETRERRFLVLDAGMDVLVRPAMYGAFHEVVPERQPPPGAALLAMDVVGPICESSDVLGRDRRLPALAPGDLVAITAAGAYGAVMASRYNSRASAAEVMVDGPRHAVVRPRIEPVAQLADDLIPEWLAADGSEETR